MPQATVKKIVIVIFYHQVGAHLAGNNDCLQMT